MSDFLIDEYGNQIWYDLESNEINLKQKIAYLIRLPNRPAFYVRPHREDGPAIISPFGDEYYIKGMKHHENGPAKILADGNTFWWLNDTHYSFEEWCKKLNKSEEEINYIRLKWNVL